MQQVDVLAIFAHPDDLELAVGGTMIKLAAFGYTTGAVDVTRGEMGTRGTPEIRAAEADAAANLLGLAVRENLGLADGHVFANETSRLALVRVLRRLKPRLLLTHQSEDPHPDHDQISRLVRESARLASMMNFDAETGAEKIAPPPVAHSIFSRRLLPSFIVDIGDHMEQKMAAIRAYRSQFHDPLSNEPETRIAARGFLEEIESRSRYFGSLIGSTAGEPFYVREALNIADPLELLSRPMNLYS